MGGTVDAAASVGSAPCLLGSTGAERCLDLVDGLVQGLVVARMRLERGESERALADLDAIIAAAQGLATRHVGRTAP